MHGSRQTGKGWLGGGAVDQAEAHRRKRRVGGGGSLCRGEVRGGLASQPRMPCALTESATSCVRTISWTPTVCHTLYCMAVPQENQTHRNPCPHKSFGSSKGGKLRPKTPPRSPIAGNVLSHEVHFQGYCSCSGVSTGFRVSAWTQASLPTPGPPPRFCEAHSLCFPPLTQDAGTWDHPHC